MHFFFLPRGWTCWSRLVSLRYNNGNGQMGHPSTAGHTQTIYPSRTRTILDLTQQFLQKGVVWNLRAPGMERQSVCSQWTLKRAKNYWRLVA